MSDHSAREFVRRSRPTSPVRYGRVDAAGGGPKGPLQVKARDPAHVGDAGQRNRFREAALDQPQGLADGIHVFSHEDFSF